MYVVNNPAYRYEANKELTIGFENLYNDIDFHKKDFDVLEKIFNKYFFMLKENIQPDNKSFGNINLIRNILLQKLRYKGIDTLVTKYKEF